MRPWLSTYVVYRASTSNSEEEFPTTWHDTSDVNKHSVIYKPCLTCCLKVYSGTFPTSWVMKLWECSALRSTTRERTGWGFRGDTAMAPHLCPQDVALQMSQRPTRPLTLDGAYAFLHAQKGAVFSYLAPLLPGAVPVIPVLLNCTAEGKNLLTGVTWRALRWCAVKHWVNVSDRQVTKSKEYLTSVCTKDGRGGGWLQSAGELFLLILSTLMVLPDDLRTKDWNKHICPKHSYRPFCNVFVATGQWPSNTLPSDTLPFNQYWQRSQTLTSTGSTGRLPTACPCLTSVAQAGYCPHCSAPVKNASLKSHCHWWRQGMMQLLLHAKGIFITGSCCQMMGHRVSLAEHRSHVICLYPVFATSDWLSHHVGTLLFVFPTVSTQLCFTKCSQNPLLLGPHRVR